MEPLATPVLVAAPRDEIKLKDDFHIEEYKALRQEIVQLKQQQFTIQKWVVVSDGIIYALALNVATESLQKTLPVINKPLLLASAFIVTLIGASFYGVNDVLMQSMSRYIQEIEGRFALGQKPTGWETFLIPSRVRDPWGVKNPFWLIGLAATALFAVLPLLFPQILAFLGR